MAREDLFTKVKDHIGDKDVKYRHDWLQRQIRSATSSNERDQGAVRSMRHRNSSSPGEGLMYFMVYAPKHADSLPYYDQFPFILPFSTALPGGFTALNLHYLPPRTRIELLNSLQGLVENNRFSSDARFRDLSWRMLKSAARDRHVQPAVKNYLFNRVRSRFITINGDEWHIAASLALEDFAKASKQQVWADSRR